MLSSCYLWDCYSVGRADNFRHKKCLDRKSINKKVRKLLRQSSLKCLRFVIFLKTLVSNLQIVGKTGTFICMLSYQFIRRNFGDKKTRSRSSVDLNFCEYRAKMTLNTA